MLRRACRFLSYLDCVKRTTKLHEQASVMIGTHVCKIDCEPEGPDMEKTLFSMRHDVIGSHGIQLLSRHYNIGVPDSEPGIAESDQKSYREKLLFASIEDFSAAQQLVECGVRIATPGKDDGLTPLHVAARNGANTVVSLLIDHGADINAVTPDGETPLVVAAKFGHGDVIEDLRSDENINKPAQGGVTPLFVAAAKNRLECVEVLAECGANVDAANDLGETPLHVAAKNGHAAMVELLLELGADAGTRTGDGGTPAAAARTSEEIVALLAKHTAAKA